MNSRLVIILLFIQSLSFGQSLDSLSALINKIQKGENDSVRIASNKKFVTAFENILLLKGSFTRNFDSLKNISVVMPDDLKFRIYSWVLPHFEGDKYEYFGFLQIHSELSDSLIPLKDSTSKILKPESEKLNPGRWYGAVYYNVIQESKSGKNYYTLLGWKAKDQHTTQKVIDVLFFNKNEPRIGYPLFKTGSVFRNRIIFSFNPQATMVLHYDKKFGGIVFDHISIRKNEPGSISGPDGTFDAFKWKKGKWILYKDIDIRTKWEPTEILPVPPEEK